MKMMTKLAKNLCSSSHSTERNQADSNRRRPGAISSAILFAIPLFFLLILIGSVGCVVVYQVRFIATNGRTDYALAGESIELSCHYIMKDEAEDIKQLVWSKDGKNFLRWRKNKPGLEVLSYTFKGHIDPSSKHSHITIHNATIDMHGKYKCWIKTDLGTHEMEQDLIVISQSQCKLNDWRITSQPSECREIFKFDCKNMFPKPVPSCGLWNGKSEKFIRSVTIDISEEPQKQTYRVRYADQFELPQNTVQISQNGSTNQQQLQKLDTDLLQFAGHLMFKCDISVPETSWKLSIIHKMFDFNDGCNQDPLETIERMRLNYSHYATNLMQQAGYLSADRQLDDFEMLAASNLKYELMRPASVGMIKKSSSAFKPTISSPELNCWQKPRIGSLARLSCANKAPDQVRLVGASLLECQQAGWAPISDNPTLASAADRGLSKQRNQQPIPRHRRPQVQRPSRRVGPAKQDADEPNAGSIAPGGSNDLDKMDDSNGMGAAASSTESSVSGAGTAGNISSATEAGETIPISTEILNLTDDHDDDDQNASRQLAGADVAASQNVGAKLTPAQLAPLLPTCVSTRRHLTNIIGNNRLPLRDEVRILESSLTSGQQQQQANKSGKQRGNKEYESKQNSIFNFSSSGSHSRTRYEQLNQTLTLLVFITIAFTNFYIIQLGHTTLTR